VPDWTKRNLDDLEDRSAPEVVYVVVSGSGRAKLGDELIELTQWDVLRVAPAVIGAFEAGPDGLEVICVGGRRPKGGDSERFEDFWPADSPAR
jgi:hypothetical protein